MALSSDAIDIAVLCSSKAAEFNNADSRFVVFPNIISNSSVIIIQNEDIKSIGVSSGRLYEKSMVSQILGEDYLPYAMNTRALAYAMESGSVGGIVMDYLSSVNVSGKRIFPKVGQKFDTYSMIVSKSIIESGKFEKFENSYNETVEYLRQGTNMLKAAEILLGETYTEERRKNEWQMLNVKIQTLEK